MTTRIHLTNFAVSGVTCDAVTIDADDAAHALRELAVLQGGTTSPNAQAASTAAQTTAPTVTQNAPAATTTGTGAPQVGATASATPTNTPPKVGSTTPQTQTAETVDPLPLAQELLEREGGDAYLEWALKEVGANTVGTCPADKINELYAHLQNGLAG